MHAMVSIRLAVAVTLACASTVLSQKYQNSSTSTSSKSYIFDASSNNNVAVYFGRTDETANTNLTAQCTDDNVDIVLLAFVLDIQGAGGYPNLAFDKICSGQTSQMVAAGATGLLSCTSIASQITTCQSAGKKIFVSIGGASGQTVFGNATAAKSAATLLWNLFGGGSGVDTQLRPFGDAVIDGFDIDNESGDGAYYDVMALALRAYFTAQTRKAYYLSAAPSCSLLADPPTNPLVMLNLMDFVWPQFYAAPSCNLGTDSFAGALNDWKTRLVGPRLYIGAPAWAGGTTNGGYEEPDAFATTIKTSQKSVGGSKFGGVMLWDGPYGHITEDSDGRDYISVSKKALTS